MLVTQDLRETENIVYLLRLFVDIDISQAELPELPQCLQTKGAIDSRNIYICQ